MSLFDIEKAEQLWYDNGDSGLSADNVQDAIDEIAAGVAVITDVLYLGAAPAGTDGNFRIISVAGVLNIEKRVAGVWEECTFFGYE